MESGRSIVIIGAGSELQKQIEHLLLPLKLKIIPGHKEIIDDRVITSILSNISIKSKLEKLHLTSRQILIVENLLHGACNKEIADVANITEQGVKYHMSRFLRKFQARNRKDLRVKICDLLEKIP